MKMLTRLLGLMLLPLLLASNAYAGDQTSTYYTANSALLMVGFKDKACAPIPTPFAYLDGEANCVRQPNTWLYKLDKGDGKVTKEVRVLEGKWSSTTTTTTTTADGKPVTVVDNMNVTDGRSVFGSFGVRNNWNISPGAIASAFGGAQSAAERARFFAAGLAAVRTSEGGSDYLSKANSLLPGNGQ